MSKRHVVIDSLVLDYEEHVRTVLYRVADLSSADVVALAQECRERAYTGEISPAFYLIAEWLDSEVTRRRALV